MGFLRNILLALGALAAAEVGYGATEPWPWGVFGLLALPHLLAGLARFAGVRGRFRLAAVLSGAVEWTAPLVQLLAVFVFGWSEAVGRLFGAAPGLVSAPGPELLAALAPYALAELAAIDARARAVDLRADVRSGLRKLQTRLFLSALLPIVVYVMLASAVSVHPTVQAWVEGVALLNGAFAAVLLVVFALVLPSVMRNTWETAPLAAGWQREVLDETARRSGFRCKEVRVWRTSNLMANAAVIGFLPHHRVVLLSDALLAQLGPAELAAVFAHEVGHVTRRHVWIFGAWALGFFLLADVALRWLALESLGLELALFAAVLVVGYLAFGFLSRRFELDADLASVDATGDPEGLIRALEQVGGAHARDKTSWRHFSVADRVRFLTRNAVNPHVGLQLRRRLRRWALLGVAVFAVGLGLEMYALVRAIPEDRVGVELRLGRYAEALERSRDLDLDERTRAALETARWVEDGAGRERLEELARGALTQGEPERALGFLDLIFLRGEEPPQGLREALADALGEGSDGSFFPPETLSPAWVEAMEEGLTPRQSSNRF